MELSLEFYRNDGQRLDDPTLCDYIRFKLMGKHGIKEGAYVLISKSDLSFILEFDWYLGKEGYPITYGTKEGSIVFGRGRKLHNLLIKQRTKKDVIDHINRDKLDNRRENLRVCSIRENNYNKTKSKNSTKSYKGIVGKNKNWMSRVMKDGKSYQIKGATTEKEAALIYDYMAEELFGIYAAKNFLEN